MTEKIEGSASIAPQLRRSSRGFYLEMAGETGV
jgi:hypothetical protein